MTIAICVRTPEGVVLGTDSTTTVSIAGAGDRYFNHAQKIFQVDDEGTLAIATWGAAGLGPLSFRTLAARWGASIRTTPPTTVAAAAADWAKLVWDAGQSQFAAEIAPAKATQAALAAINAAMAAGQPPPPSPRPDELAHLAMVESFLAGFYVVGRNRSDCEPDAYRVELRLTTPAPHVPVQLPLSWSMNGSCNLASRLVKGWDTSLIDAIVAAAPAPAAAPPGGAPAPPPAPYWTGSRADLERALSPFEWLVPVALPIREAVDFVHFVVHATIKATKFAGIPPGIGGPVEVAVITSDRPLRWIRHKPFDAAI